MSKPWLDSRGTMSWKRKCKHIFSPPLHPNPYYPMENLDPVRERKEQASPPFTQCAPRPKWLQNKGGFEQSHFVCFSFSTELKSNVISNGTFINIASLYLGGFIGSNTLVLVLRGFSNYTNGQKCLVDFCSDLFTTVLTLSLVKTSSAHFFNRVGKPYLVYLFHK